ncbi:MAG: protein phosphatase 2C domain-containing protein [Myxococcales bacterium]|nr:protein phosphatase 2C domain-containing protein [Myxococcales bacterium]MCB9750027.1 protein phosphatase 2C domain-containing protein [Myxococcales bacterium]
MFTRGSGRSHPGRVREQNEDNHVVDDALGLYVVSDGMGGHAAGEVASQLTVDVVRQTIVAGQAIRTAVANGERPLAELAALAERAVLAACAAVYERAREDRRLAGMGCTVTMLLVAGARAVLAHVGDSRLYLLRDGVVYRLSSDHTLAAEMSRAGAFSEEHARTHHFAHTLTRSVGMQLAVAVDTLELALAPADRFVLCSDGLSNYLERDELLATLTPAALDAAPDGLIAHANASGGADNVTVIVVDVPPEAELTNRARRRQRALEAMSRSPLFEGYPLRSRARLLACGRLVSFKRDERLIARGQPLRSLFICLGGQLEVRASGDPPVTLNAGDAFGMATLFHERAALASVVGAAPGDVLELERSKLMRLLRKRPRLGVGTLERLLALVSRNADLV